MRSSRTQSRLHSAMSEAANATINSVEHCSATPCHSMLWRDVTLQFVPDFDIAFDVIACT